MRILITYQYFLPAYKAGGPVQSISNTATMLSTQADTTTYILCSNSDLDGTLSDVPVNRWVDYIDNVKVYYNAAKATKKSIINIISAIEPDVIFINGIYSLPYTIYPLLYKHGRAILSVRGMLHPGALSQKSTKKKVFLTVFKLLGLHKQCEFHATTDEEVIYIKNEFGNDCKMWMVPNLPNVLPFQKSILKENGTVKLVSISLISAMKNILLVLQALKDCTSDIVYHIFGPVKDKQYWDKCVELIQVLPSNVLVEYKGEVTPDKVGITLQQYHYFVLPSKSENFGHAIFEALSAGRPVITSHNTPWNELKQADAGYNVDPESSSELASVFDEIACIGNMAYQNSATSARKYILSKYDLQSVASEYCKMFGIKSNNKFQNQ